MKLLKISAAALLVVTLGATPALSEDKITLKFADQFPLKHPGSIYAGQAFKRMVESRSKGRVEIKYYPAQQLAKAKGMLDAVKNRVTDIGMVGVVYVSDKLPLSSIVELPGLFTDLKKGLIAFDKLAKNEIASEYKKNKVHPLFMAATPPYQLQFAKLEEVNDLSDLKGLKIRVSGSTGQMVVGSLDAVGLRLSGPDTYLAVERGTVDATMLTMPSVFSYKLPEIVKSTTRNASLGTVAFSILINEDVWKGLPADVQKLMNDVSNDISKVWSKQWTDMVNSGYGKAQKAGMKVIDLSPKVLGQMDERLSKVQGDWIKQMNSRGLPGEKALVAFKKYLAEQN